MMTLFYLADIKETLKTRPRLYLLLIQSRFVVLKTIVCSVIIKFPNSNQITCIQELNSSVMDYVIYDPCFQPNLSYKGSPKASSYISKSSQCQGILTSSLSNSNPMDFHFSSILNRVRQVSNVIEKVYQFHILCDIISLDNFKANFIARTKRGEIHVNNHIYGQPILQHTLHYHIIKEYGNKLEATLHMEFKGER